MKHFKFLKLFALIATAFFTLSFTSKSTVEPFLEGCDTEYIFVYQGDDFGGGVHNPDNYLKVEAITPAIDCPTDPDVVCAIIVCEEWTTGTGENRKLKVSVSDPNALDSEIDDAELNDTENTDGGWSYRILLKA